VRGSKRVAARALLTNRYECKRREGQSLVELALAVPLLLLLLLGTIDIGRAFFDYIDMRNAAREGAGYYARNPTDSSGAVTRVKNHGVPGDVTVSVVCENGSCTTINGTGRVRVTVSRTFTPVTTGFLSTFGLGSFQLTASATMRVMT
jgi:hypothetical protein